MDKEDDTTFIFTATEKISSDGNVELKRKRAVEVIHTAKRDGTGLQDCKHPKGEATDWESIHGSVAYQSFPPEVYGWPSKVSVQDACNFQRSGLPSRFMYYEEGKWKDFRKNEFATMRDSFRARKSFVELFVDGKRYLVNFLQMLQVNLLTGLLRSVAWIDEHGKCFFPSKLVEGHGTRLHSQLRDTFDRQHRLAETDFNAEACLRGFDSFHDGLIRICSDQLNSPLVNASVEVKSEITSDSRVGGEALGNTETHGRATHDFALLGDKLIKLDEGDPEFAIVRNRFLAGLGMLATSAAITGIYRDTHTSTSGQARLQAFKKQEEITRKARGDANVKYAWHGTSKHGVSGIVLHGFGQPRIPKNGAMYGVGAYLAPEEYSHVSAVYSDVDENGEQHMLLCQAVMGSTEQVSAGSEQFHPSKEDYDTGVDDIYNPKRYIIWSTHMNTHVLPQYIVSFKLPPQWHGVMASLRGKQSVCKALPVVRASRLDCQSTADQSAFVKVGNAILTPCIAEIKASIGGGLSQGCVKRAPRSPWMSFPMLFLMMKSKLSPVNMAALQQHYHEFKAGRMSRDVLIKILRAVAGDRILVDCIKSMQAQEKANPRLTEMDSSTNFGLLQRKEYSTTPLSREESFV